MKAMMFLLPAFAAAMPLGAVPPAASPALPRPVVPNKIQDRFVPAPFEAEKIDGLLGERMRVNLEGRLLRVDEKGLIEGFQHRPGKQDWIGEHAGKFLDAAVNSWRLTHDPRLKALMDRIDRELVAAQEPDGYLGTYTTDQRWTSWDVWVHKYDLIGLLSYYRATGDRVSLLASRRIGDLLVRTFGEKPGQRDLISAGEHVGMAATSVLEPMVNLYRYTGTRRYLDFCFYITRDWEQPKGPRILSSLAPGGSVYRTANGKAYEMLSNLVGLAELYRLTGEARFLAPVNVAWEDVAAHRLYLSGTASSKEHFTDDEQLPADEEAHVGEGCVTVTWMQLNLELLRLTGEAKYGDQLERSIFNQLLAAQNPHTGDICYFTPLNGHKDASPGISCCVSSEPRGISLIPQTVWGQSGGGVTVLQYTPGRVTAPEATVVAETDFPRNGRVFLSVTPHAGAAFPLRLRVPEWASRFTATVAGKRYDGQAGEFLSIAREWKTGDRVEIDMDMTVAVIGGGRSYPDAVAVRRGPQVLALESELNPGIADMKAARPKSVEAAALHLAEVFGESAASGSFPEAFAIDAADGKRLTLVPFADAQDYRVWLKRP